MFCERADSDFDGVCDLDEISEHLGRSMQLQSHATEDDGFVFGLRQVRTAMAFVSVFSVVRNL